MAMIATEINPSAIIWNLSKTEFSLVCDQRLRWGHALHGRWREIKCRSNSPINDRKTCRKIKDLISFILEHFTDFCLLSRLKSFALYNVYFLSCLVLSIRMFVSIFKLGLKVLCYRKAWKSVRNGSQHTCVCILWDNGDISRSLSGHLSPPCFYQRVAFIIGNILCSFALKWLISKQRLLKSPLSTQTTDFCLFCFMIYSVSTALGAQTAPISQNTSLAHQ